MQIVAILFLGLILLGLSTMRLSLMFVQEVGPLHIFARLREWADIQEMQLPNGETEKYVIGEEKNLIGGILSCTWCASVWFSGLLLLYTIVTWLISPFIAICTLLWLSASMLSIIGSVWIERLQDENRNND